MSEVGLGTARDAITRPETQPEPSAAHREPSFCIVTPAFDSVSTIASAVRSVLDQDWTEWTMVVIDDGSSDGTAEAATAAAAGDERVSVIRQANAGAAAARNRGIAEAGHADFLVFLDADDQMLPDYLSSQAGFIREHPGHAIYSCNGWMVRPEGRRTLIRPEEKYARPCSLTLRDLARVNHVFVMACVSSQALCDVGGFREDVYAEDYDLWLRLLASGRTHLMNPRPLGLYGLTAGSKSSDRVRQFRSAEASVLAIVEGTALSREDRSACLLAAERYRALADRYEAEDLASQGRPEMLRSVVRTAGAAYAGRGRHAIAMASAFLSPTMYLWLLGTRRPGVDSKDPWRWVRPRSQVGVNIGANAALLGLQTLVGLWFAPYLVRNLGVAAYGLIPLANSVAAYLSIIEIGIRGSTGRFVGIALAKGDDAEASRMFGTTLWASMAMGVLMLPVALGVSFFSPLIFDVPAGLERSAQLFFCAVLVMYLAGVVRSVLTVPPFVQNRFELQNLNAFSEIATRLVLVVMLFTLFGPRLDWVGLSLVASGSVATVVALFVCRRVAPSLRFHPREFSVAQFRNMWNTSAWMMVNQVGTLLFLSIEMIVVNVILGAAVAGRYGSLLTWSTFMRTFAGGIASVVTPLALTLYAKGDLEGMTRVMRQSVRILGTVVALPVGAIVGLGPVLLTAWLGPEFADLSTLLTVQVLHLAVNLAVLPLFSAQLAVGKVKVPGMVTLVAGLVNVALAVALARFGDFGSGVAIAGALVLTGKNALFTTLYGARIQSAPALTYVTALVPALIATAGAAVTSRMLAIVLGGTGWPTVLGAGAGAAAVVGSAAYLFVFTPGERAVVKKLLPSGAR